MESISVKRPAAVIATTVIFGILSVFTFVSPDVTGDPTSLAALIRKAIFLVGFIGALSGTLWGRKVVVVILSLLLLGSVAGIYAAIHKFPNDVGEAVAIAFVASLPALWFYWYTFGSASKSYFQKLRARAHNNSLPHDGPDGPRSWLKR